MRKALVFLSVALLLAGLTIVVGCGEKSITGKYVCRRTSSVVYFEFQPDGKALSWYSLEPENAIDESGLKHGQSGWKTVLIEPSDSVGEAVRQPECTNI